jgi:hypothetical protein
MHRFFGTLRCQRPLRAPRQECVYEPGPPLPYIMAGPAHDQRQCVLFNALSSEIRLLVYEAALSDPVRLLHVVPYRGEQKRQAMGHWRCVDEESPYPTWQHTCFGIWLGEKGKHHRKEPRSSDNLVSLLLACRLVQVFTDLHYCSTLDEL